jgi:hypothetical protein
MERADESMSIQRVIIDISLSQHPCSRQRVRFPGVRGLWSANRSLRVCVCGIVIGLDDQLNALTVGGNDEGLRPRSGIEGVARKKTAPRLIMASHADSALGPFPVDPIPSVDQN